MIVAAACAMAFGQQASELGTPAAVSEGPLLFAAPPMVPAKLIRSDPATGEAARSRVPSLAARLKMFGEEPFESPPPEAANEEKPASRTETNPASEKPDSGAGGPAEPETRPQPLPKPELSPEMAELRDRVRRTLLYYHAQPFNTQSNTPADIISFCRAFGCDTEIRTSSASSRTRSSSAKTISGIGALCWNYPCAGRYLLTSDQGQFIPRIGYGYQRHPGEFLAMLALAQVDLGYEIRVDQQHGTVADLVRCEQRHCQSGSDLSFVLLGLARYLPRDATWQNDRDEPWSLERLVQEELERRADLSGPAAVDRLMGLSSAVASRNRREEPLEGQFRRAADYLRDFQDHALALQNADGSWHPRFFANRGTSRDTLGVLRSTGHILQWLAFSLPADRLEGRPLVEAVGRVNSLLAGQSSQSSRRYVNAMSPRDIETMTHALCALAIYDRRVFKPADPADPAPEGQEVATARSF